MKTTTSDPCKRDDAGREGGFTLIELMVVVAILGMIAGWVMVDYSGITNRQKLATTCREFVGVYRQLRGLAAKERRYCVIEFDMERQIWRRLVYPMTDEFGNYIDGEGEIMDPDWVAEIPERTRWKRIPKGVFLVDIMQPGDNGADRFEQDFYLEFRQDGTIPPHILHFQTKGLQMSLEIDEITGTPVLKEGYTEIYQAEDSDFQLLTGGGSLAK